MQTPDWDAIDWKAMRPYDARSSMGFFNKEEDLEVLMRAVDAL